MVENYEKFEGEFCGDIMKIFNNFRKNLWVTFQTFWINFQNNLLKYHVYRRNFEVNL